MTIKLKPIEEQVFVVTGASSGIGLATAETAAQKGAMVVLAARSAQTIQEIAERLKTEGCGALAIPVDVTDRRQMQQLAETVATQCGRIDTWVNNAGLSIYGRLDEVNDEDSHRLFDTNFWGAVHGSLAALPYLRRQGGALINVGSEVSEAAVPLQGMYAATKHAVKGFTDALRVEVMEVDRAPASITLIQPTAVNTPFAQHAKDYLKREPKLPDSMIDPQKVADAIIEAAQKPTHHVKVGMMAKVNTFMSNNAPKIAERMAAKYVDKQQKNEPPHDPDGTLCKAGESGRRHGEVAHAR